MNLQKKKKKTSFFLMTSNENLLISQTSTSNYVDSPEQIDQKVYFAVPEQPHDLCFPLTITIILPFFGLLAICFIKDKYVSKRVSMVGACLLFVYSVIATGFVVQYLRTH